MSDILKVIELAKLGKCTPEDWESLPVEIRERILEIRIQVPEIKVNHNVKVTDPGKAAFKAALGYGCSQLLLAPLVFLMGAGLILGILVAFYALVGAIAGH